MLFGRRLSSFRGRTRFAPAMAVFAFVFTAGCNDNTSPTSPRAYNQLQRLGNPLVSEVLLMKRNHPLHGSIGPDQDVALIRPEVTSFLTNVAGRAPAYAAMIAGVLTPDILVIQTDKNPATAGWLSWALSDGWGGRKLDDDVVDLALTAVFGSALGDAAHATPALTSDHVGFDSPTTATFPYLGAAN